MRSGPPSPEWPLSTTGPPKTVTVTAAGRDYDCRYFAAYANPAVNDFVVVVHNASQGIVLGRLA